MFKIEHYDDGNRIIQWEVPFYPQKDVNSCWYYGAEMLIGAYHHNKIKPQTTTINKFAIQITGLVDKTEEQKFFQENKFFKLELELDPTRVCEQLFQILKKYGPILLWGPHVFPIVGVDCVRKMIFVHYTVPLVYEKPKLTEYLSASHEGAILIKARERFWSGGKHTRRQVAIASNINARIDLWFDKDNYEMIQQPWNPQSAYSSEEYSPDKFIQEYQSQQVGKPTKEITDEWLATYLRKPLDEIRAIPESQKKYWKRCAQEDFNKQEKDFYVASRMFSPDVLDTVKNMQIPADWFCGLLNQHVSNQRCDIVFYCLEGPHYRNAKSALTEAIEARQRLEQFALSRRPISLP